MKNLLNILFILLFISSCSDTDSNTFPEIDDEEEEKDNTEKIIPLKLEIEETKKIFSTMQYSVCSPTNMVLCLLYSMFMIQSHGKSQI